MRNSLVLALLFFAQWVSAQSVQVPENCIGKVSPCLVHTADQNYQFIYDGLKVTVLKDAILRIVFDDGKSNFEVLDGRIMIKKSEKNLKSMAINGQAFKSGWQMVNRSLAGGLSVLDLNTFMLSNYSSSGTNPVQFTLVKSGFVDKNDFVGFTKFYFQDLKAYKSFLTGQSGHWKEEFDKQNSSQTKVLFRTIASEKEKAKAEARQNSHRTDETKKVREIFFYRTFER